jgi:signal transduction histidine kinase/CheY-like chemotaxis protein
MNRWVTTFLIVLAVTAVGGAVAYSLYDAQKRELSALAARDMTREAQGLAGMVSTLFEPAFAMTETIGTAGLSGLSLEDKAARFMALTAGMIRRYEAVNGAYLGFPDGGFIQVQDLETRVDGGPEPKAGDVILTARIIDATRSVDNEQWWIFEPETGVWRPDFTRTATYDPRTRPWYEMVRELGFAAWTNPYTFASSGVPGVTYAGPMIGPDGGEWAVLGIDFSLESLSRTVAEISETIVQDAEIVFAADPDNRLYGAFDLEGGLESHPLMRRTDVVQAVLSRTYPAGEVERVAVEGIDLLTMALELDPKKGMPLRVFLARDVESIHANATEAIQRNLVLVLCLILVAAVITSYAYRLWAEVAARKKVEAALVESRDAAEAATRSKSVFLATMSHEIRTPMNGIMSMAELLSHSRLTGEQRDMLKVVNDSAKGLLAIINDILDFSKIEAGKFDLESIPFSLTDTVDGTAELLASRAHERGLELSVGIDPTLVDLRVGDPTRLRQILLNLGGNAIKFTSEGSVEIVVSKAGPRGERLRFEVIDTGIGLSEEALGKLFTPFTQADSSTSRKYGGTGLGLSICRRLVEMMDGEIGADSVLGEGTTFWFELPLTPSEDAPPAPAHDLSAAVVGTIGLSNREAGVVERYLRAGGVRDIAHLDDIPSEPTPNIDLWLIATRVLIPGTGTFEALSGAVALVGGRLDIAEALEPAPARPVLRLTTPLSRTALWRAAAVALGLEPWEDTETQGRADMDFTPPPRDEAAAADALILVAEDNETNRLVIRKLLGRLGYACDMAENGKIALDRLQRPGHGLLLTDFNMPEMDGRELTQAVRAEEAAEGLPRLPVIALTADAMAGAEAACLEAGMDAYLTKPVDSGKLAALLAEMLPAATALRRPAVEEGAAPEVEGTAPTLEITLESLGWDPEILDPTTLGGPSGVLDAEALDLIESAALDWKGKLARIEAAMAEGDLTAARGVVHALKGATLSVGATRMGRIAADTQDCLDMGDKDMADLLVAGLAPSLSEFEAVLPRLRET